MVACPLQTCYRWLQIESANGSTMASFENRAGSRDRRSDRRGLAHDPEPDEISRWFADRVVLVAEPGGHGAMHENKERNGDQA